MFADRIHSRHSSPAIKFDATPDISSASFTRDLNPDLSMDLGKAASRAHELARSYSPSIQ